MARRAKPKFRMGQRVSDNRGREFGEIWFVNPGTVYRDLGGEETRYTVRWEDGETQIVRECQLLDAAEAEREVERRHIMDRLLAAEFGGSPVTAPPSTPVSQWPEVLGEPIRADLMAEAERLFGGNG